MSVEETLALAASEVGAAREVVLAFPAVATTQITRIGNSYDAIVNSQLVNRWVDQENGNDANEGLIDSPLKSIQAVINLAPRGGTARVFLTNDYHLDADIDGYGRHVEIRSVGGKHRITTDRYNSVNVTTHRNIYGFHLSHGSLYFESTIFEMPPLENWGQWALAKGSFFNPRAGEGWGSVNVSCALCEFDIPAVPFSWFFPNSATIEFMNYSATYPGAITNPLGRMFQGQTNTAGVATADLGWLQSNLINV